MANEKIYAKGLRVFAKNEKAPEFVVASIVITPNELVEWCRNNSQYLTEYNGDAQLKLQVLKSDKTGINLVVDTYKSKPKGDLPF